MSVRIQSPPAARANAAHSLIKNLTEATSFPQAEI
jgi:hypothetical protein